MSTTVERIDLGYEESASMLDEPIDDSRAWLAREVDKTSCVIKVDETALDEMIQMAEQMRAQPLPVVLRDPAQFAMPALRDFMAHARELLDGVPGIAVIDRLPMDILDEQDAISVFWTLGRLIGRPVAQKWDGTMLYDVMDKGVPYSYGVRGSYTNVELLFHTDNAFAVAPPEYVALLCIRPAVRGGVSRFCSIHALHNRLLARYPRQLERLYECVLWDRQAEHAPGAAKVTWAPVFRYHDKQLSARLNVSLIKKGYEVGGVPMDDATADALSALDEIADDPELWFELPIERGQLQYLNNKSIAHYRSEFVDHDDPVRKRHLVRTWHREWGQPTYDG